MAEVFDRGDKPVLLINAQPFKNLGKVSGNSAALVIADGTTGPVHQIKVVDKMEWDARNAGLQGFIAGERP